MTINKIVAAVCIKSLKENLAKPRLLVIIFVLFENFRKKFHILGLYINLLVTLLVTKFVHF